MKKNGLFFIGTPQIYFLKYVWRGTINLFMNLFAMHTKLANNFLSSDFHTLSYNPHTEFLLSITIWLSYSFWGVKLKYVINTIIYLTLLYFWFCRMGWICETDLIGFRKKIGEW
jgi:hypothetical protein